MIPHNNIGLFPITLSTRKYISIHLSKGTSRIWICSWDNLEDSHNNKYEKIVLKEPSVSLNTSWIWANHSFTKLIRSVRDKTHVSDFLDSSPFSQNVNRKNVTCYSSKFLSWNIEWCDGDQICNFENILEAKMVSDVTKYINKPSLVKLCIIIINLLIIKEKKLNSKYDLS